MLVFCCFGHWSQALTPLDSSVLLCLACEKKAFSGQIRLLLSEEHVWSGFQYVANTCIQPVHRDLCAARRLIHPMPWRCLGGIKQGCLPRANLLWGWSSFTDMTVAFVEDSP